MLVNLVKTLRGKRSEAMSILPERLLPFLDRRRVVVASWYPEEDLLELLKAAAGVMSSAGENIFEKLGSEAAKRDTQTYYRRMVVPGDLEGTLRRIPSLWNIYHDTGAVQVEQNHDGSAQIKLMGYEMQEEELCQLHHGYLRQLLELSGCEDFDLIKSQCRSNGAGQCAWDLNWDPSSTAHAA